MARFADTWVTVDSRGPIEPQIVLLDEACTAAGRATKPARLVLLGHRVKPLVSSRAFGEFAEEFASLGFTDLVVHWPRVGEPFKAEIATLEQIAADHLQMR